MASDPHRVAYIAPEDEAVSGTRPLWAFGPFHVAELSGRSRRTIRAETKAGLPLHIITEAVAYAVAKRGRPDIADDVLELLGYERRYTARK